MFTNQDIIDTLNVLLNERGWSVNHLAAVAELPQSTINSMFHGRKEYYPSFPTLNKICDALNISVSEFLLMVESDSRPEPSPEENRMIAQMRKLTWLQRKYLLEFLEAMNFVQSDEDDESGV